MTLLLYLFQFSLVLSLFSSDANTIFPDIDGFQKNGDVEIYNPDYLFDYINGAADSYLKYDFEELRLTKYKGNAEQTLKIEIYQHSNNTNAFGIYSNERPQEGNWVDVGIQGYSENTILNFYRGKYYVKLFGYKIENGEEFLLDLAKEVASKLDGETELPKLLKLFPDENKIKNSERFILKNFLGYRALTEAFTAEYKIDDKEFKMFVIKKGDSNSCKKMLEEYFSTIKMDKAKIVEGIIKIKDPYQGEINILWEDNIVMGMLNCSNSLLSEEYLTKMSSGIKNK